PPATMPPLPVPERDIHDNEARPLRLEPTCPSLPELCPECVLSVHVPGDPNCRIGVFGVPRAALAWELGRRGCPERAPDQSLALYDRRDPHIVEFAGPFGRRSCSDTGKCTRVPRSCK